MSVDDDIAAAIAKAMATMKKDLEPDPDRHGIFRDHNCWKCKSGEYPCCNGNPYDCEFPHARND